jgi:hypothetical protein
MSRVRRDSVDRATVRRVVLGRGRRGAAIAVGGDRVEWGEPTSVRDVLDNEDAVVGPQARRAHLAQRDEGQLRGMVERSLFYQNPKKQRWLKRYLWRKENLWRVDRQLIIQLIMFLIALAAAIAAYLKLFSK